MNNMNRSSNVPLLVLWAQEAVEQFVEALHDGETSPATVRSRASKLKDFGITLPRSVNIVMCKKEADEFVQNGKLEELFQFLAPSDLDSENGIAAVLPQVSDEKDRKEMLRDVQLGCITHLVNNLLLKEFQGNPEDKELLGEFYILFL